jgi:hypothetical protein
MYKFSHFLNKMGMTKKKFTSHPLTDEEKQLIEQLREQPALRVRFQNILGLTRPEGAARKTADEVEGLLIEEMRRLGHAGMSQWAAQVEEQVSRNSCGSNPRCGVVKKKC